MAPAVHLGRVEVGDAGVQRGVHDGGGLLGVDAHAEVVAPQPDDRQLRATQAQLALLH
jgi:hypothetical protein